MQVWIRQAEYFDFVYPAIPVFCTTCPIYFGDIATGEAGQEDFLGDMVWLHQKCECNCEYFTLGSAIIPIWVDNCHFVPLQFIELSPYDNYSFQE